MSFSFRSRRNILLCSYIPKRNERSEGSLGASDASCNGVTHRRVLGTLCLRHMECYPTERDIEYLIGLKGLTVVSHEIGKISKVLDLGHECLD
uniref:Uncharacterized protein n=1 Tax=Hyaloperonospora arabidopsidis (strain Emoy2) TaxID=559515 RepID=M4BVG9_HYAAE